MNEPYNIYFSPTKPVTLITELDSAYQFRKDKKHHWLQKICIFILNKLGAKKMISDNIITRYEVKPQKFLDQLLDQKYYIIKQLNMTPKELLIGSEEFAKIMREEDQFRYFTMKLDYRYGTHESIFVSDLKVTVIPYMKGMILIPKGHN